MRRSLSFLIPFVLLLVSPARAGEEKLQVEGVRHGMTREVVRIVLDLNRRPDFRAFVLDNPYRLVVDLPLAEWKTSRSRFISSSLVKSYRSGVLDDGMTRIIFDLKKPALIDNAFTMAKDEFNKNRLVLDMKTVSVNLFNAGKEDISGNRDIKGVGKGDGASSAPSGRGLGAMQNTLLMAAVPAAPPVKTPAKSYIVVVVDPGHGGEDQGAAGHGVKEKIITLAVAKELKRQLEETGRYKVVLTRDRDSYVKLHERVDISRRVGGDLFISIHADKIDRNGVRGASVYTLSEKASDAETARLAEGENNAGFVAGVDLSQESKDVSDILLDLAMREKMNESNMFARMLIHAFLRNNIRLLPNSHRSAGFAVLKAPDVPSVLIEIGFLSNTEEAKLLNSGQFQRNIAASILNGVDLYFRKIQSLQKL